MSVQGSALTDPFGREIRSLRISVTQRCDLACDHCHREGQTPSLEEMTAAEIERVVRVAATLGVRKVKLTGGEPLIREDITEIVSRISPHLKEVSMTTNGTRLTEFAADLRRAGLRRVNVSLHTLDPSRYRAICGRDVLGRVVEGIHAAKEAGLSPVKVNMVVMKSLNEDEIESMLRFCGRAGVVLQLIEYESDREGVNGCAFARRYYSLAGVEEGLRGRAVEISINELHRRRRYRVPDDGTAAEVEVVRPMHNTEFCANCTRIRLSSDGVLKPCLLDREGAVDILTPLRSGATDETLTELFMRAVGNRRPYWR